jgi:hypothetical protein
MSGAISEGRFYAQGKNLVGDTPVVPDFSDSDVFRIFRHVRLRLRRDGMGGAFASGYGFERERSTGFEQLSRLYVGNLHQTVFQCHLG